MNDYLEIFSDVVLLATFQPMWRERYSSAPRLGEVSRDRPRDPAALQITCEIDKTFAFQPRSPHLSRRKSGMR